jgi:hypothetical protein
MFDAIPVELKALRAWIAWKAELVKGVVTKVPYNPITGAKASSTNANTWNSCADVLAALAGYNGPGLVLTQYDPYICIDLDNKANNPNVASEIDQVYKWLDSYTEVSPSGLGLHVWVKASMPTGFLTFKGRGIEVYSTSRYMTMTGNCIHKPGIIEDRYEAVCELIAFLSKNRERNAPVADIEAWAQEPELLDDKAVFDMACQATNGDKFQALWNNQDWYRFINGKDTSQSVADQALMNMLVFYTKNKDQIIRLFHYSALGKREKAYRKDYLNRTIKKAFDQTIKPIAIDLSIEDLRARFATNEAPEPPEIPLFIESGQSAVSGASQETSAGGAEASVDTSAAGEDVVASNTPIIPVLPPVKSNYTAPHGTPAAYHFPPGLVGELAEYLLAAAPHPVHEAALVAALGLVAGVCGRVYQIDGLGLNLYLCLLAKTGSGKNAISTGIGKLITAVPDYPSAFQFVGPKSFASAPSFDTVFQQTPCIVSVITEFGKKLRKFTNPNIKAIDEDVSAAYLDAFTASSKGFMWGKTARSDKDKTSRLVVSPSLTIVAESTPHKFYEAIDEDNIAEGLVSRMLVIEYTGDREYLSDTFNSVVPSYDMLTRIKAMMQVNQQCMVADRVEYIDVLYTPEAKAMFKVFGDNITDHIRASTDENIRALWTRAYEKTAKLAGVIATGIVYGQGLEVNTTGFNPKHNVAIPTICVNCAQWAINLVTYEINRIIKVYVKGDLGIASDDLKCLEHVENEIRHYVINGPKKFRPDNDNKFRNQNPVMMCISRSYLSAFAKTKYFKKHKLGINTALTRTLEVLCANGVLVKLNDVQKHVYQSNCELYRIVGL